MRATILETVRDQPGQHFRAVQRDAGCSSSTLNYHVRRCDALVDEDIRGYRRIYPRDVPAELRSPLGALNHDVRGPILALLHDQPQVSFGEVVEALGKAASTTSHHLGVLDDAELIAVEAEGRTRRYSATPVTRDAVDAYGDSLLDRLSDNFIDMWG